MVRINGYPIDATMSEDHAFDSEVTSHPVEEGADVTDHVREIPIVVVLECVVSNTPFGGIVFERDPNELPSSEAYARMLAIRDKREPVTIETSLSVFHDMVLRRLSVPRTSRTGDALRFRATFQQIQLVRTERTFVIVEVPRAKKKVNRGHKPSPEAPGSDAPPPSAKTDETASSWKNAFELDKIVEGLGG